MPDWLGPIVQKALEGQSIAIVIGTICVICVLFKSPELISVFLTHSRENKKILSEIHLASRRLDHEINSKTAKVKARKHHTRDTDQ